METQSSIRNEHYVPYRVRYYLNRRKRTQAWLASEMERGVMWMSRRMKGEVAFDVEEIQQVAEILGVEVAALFPPTHIHHEARAS